MRIRYRLWMTGFVIAAAVAVAYVKWPTRVAPVPEILRPGPSAFKEPEVQKDVAGAARRVELEPRSAAAWGEYGIVLRAYRQHPEADRCFQVAADLDPADGRWPYLIGVHLADADPTAALPWLERAARGTVPAAARETVLGLLVETLLAAGRPAEALTALGPDPAESPPRLRLAAARAAAATGDDRTAAELLGDLADQPAAARQALLLRSEICRRQGRTSYANYLAGLAADAPQGLWPDPLADPIRSRDMSHGGRVDEAARLLRAMQPVEAERLLRPLTSPPSEPDPRVFTGLAEAREAQGDLREAMELLTQAVRIDPKSLAANYQIGLLHFHKGEQLWVAGQADEARAEFREAVTWLDNALAINPDFGKGLLLKGAALYRFLGQQENGLALLRRFVQLRPEVAEGHLQLGQALAESGQKDAAAASLRRAAELAQPGDRRAAEALAKIGEKVKG
ncbi:MAG: tetratricopeptide repeat protein [Gemmataceae bacterium]